jgi:hypothetical protein
MMMMRFQQRLLAHHRIELEDGRDRRSGRRASAKPIANARPV